MGRGDVYTCMMNAIGPFVKKLIAERWAQLMVERAGTINGRSVGNVAARIVEDNGASLKNDMQDAVRFVEDAIKAIRAAPGGNPNATNEEIAEKILKGVKEKRGGSSSSSR